MKKFSVFFVAISFLTFLHCSSAESGNNAASSKQRYSLKQACIEYKIIGDMFSGTEKLYFDSYGMREAKYSYQNIKVMGMTKENNTGVFTNYEEDGIIYTYDYKTKTGTKMKNPLQDAFKEQDMKDVGKKMVEQMGGKKTGTGKILGKQCDIWEIKNMGSKTWIWNWIPLKTETNMMGMKMTIEATKISETFDKKKLEKPNVEYKDMSDAMKGMKGLDLDALKKRYKKD